MGLNATVVAKCVPVLRKIAEEGAEKLATSDAADECPPFTAFVVDVMSFLFKVGIVIDAGAVAADTLSGSDLALALCRAVVTSCTAPLGKRHPVADATSRRETTSAVMVVLADAPDRSALPANMRGRKKLRYSAPRKRASWQTRVEALAPGPRATHEENAAFLGRAMAAAAAASPPPAHRSSQSSFVLLSSVLAAGQRARAAATAAVMYYLPGVCDSVAAELAESEATSLARVYTCVVVDSVHTNGPRLVAECPMRVRYDDYISLRVVSAMPLQDVAEADQRLALSARRFADLGARVLVHTIDSDAIAGVLLGLATTDAAVGTDYLPPVDLVLSRKKKDIELRLSDVVHGVRVRLLQNGGTEKMTRAVVQCLVAALASGGTDYTANTKGRRDWEAWIDAITTRVARHIGTLDLEAASEDDRSAALSWATSCMARAATVTKAVLATHDRLVEFFMTERPWLLQYMLSGVDVDVDVAV